MCKTVTFSTIEDDTITFQEKVDLYYDVPWLNIMELCGLLDQYIRDPSYSHHLHIGNAVDPHFSQF